MTVAERIINRWKERREQDAVRLAENLLDHPAMDALKTGVADIQTRTRLGIQSALRLVGLPSHADYDKVIAVLSRSGRKLSALEANLARVESLVERVGPVARVPASSSALSKPQESRQTRAKKPAVSRPAVAAAQPHVRKKKAKPAVRPAAKAPSVKPTDLAGVRAQPQYKSQDRRGVDRSIVKPARSAAAKLTGGGSRERLLTPLGPGKPRISDVAVRAKKSQSTPPASIQMLTGFSAAPKKKAR